MRNDNERIFIKNCSDILKEEFDHCADGHSIEVYGFASPPERFSPAKEP
jgi:hypothetical protein